MTDVFVLRDQHNNYLNKSLEWIAAGDSKTLYRTAHRDEVINQRVELTVKHPELRIRAVDAEQASNGRILIDGQECIPKAEEPKDETDLFEASKQVPQSDEEPALSKCS